MADHKSVHLIGNAHLDPVWLWRWQEGYAEIKATFRSALDRLNEFPDFVFTCACAAYYKWVEENAPEMFAEIRDRIAEGRWVVTGGWWIQPDCNLPSGESFARHSLYGQTYFLDKFGVTARVGYNVDSFGHHGMLPQILKRSGMDYYVFMRPEEHEKSLPGDLFWWESADGSRVMTFRLSDSYGNWGEGRLERKIAKHRLLADERGHGYMSFYGVGNHGGGPTIANLKLIGELQTREDGERLKLSSPNAFFAEMEKENSTIPVIRDEMQRHAVGCYSAHSESKALNRQAEHRLLTAEKFAALARLKLGLPYPGQALKQAWENVMFNHFHDIMGGCSVKEAFDDVREFYGEALSLSARALNASLQKISWSIHTMKPGVKALNKEKHWQLWEQNDLGTPVVLFNPLSWEVEAPVQLNKLLRSVTDESGTALPIQKVRATRTNADDKWDTLIMATIPAFGYRVYWAYLDKEHEVPELSHPAVITDATSLENGFVRIELDPHTGYIRSIVDKLTGTELLGGSGAVPIVVDEHHSDTWGHGLKQFRDEIGRFGDAEIKVLEQGPLQGTLRVTSRYNGSQLRQDISLCHSSPDIRVKVQLEWRERHKMLKLSFPVRAQQARSVSEIPYGFIERPMNGDEVPGQQWVDVSGRVPGETERGVGLALLNDAKYGYDVLDGDIRMTVVRSPIYADHFGNRDDQVEFMDQGIQQFSYALVPHQGCWREAGIVRKAHELNVKPIAVWETYHEGTLPQRAEDISISARSVIAMALKRAEDGGGWVVRCYETAGEAAEADITLPAFGRRWSSTFGGCEIKTFYIPDDAGLPVKEVNFIELEQS